MMSGPAEADTVVVGSHASVPPSPFQCSQCHRAFSRLDHLSRHVRTHTLEKPYWCTFCDKSFARADLLKRHNAQHANRSPHRHNVRRPLQHGRRVSQACKACASSKLKCTDGKPCTRCMRKGVDCEYEQALPQSSGVNNELNFISPEKENSTMQLNEPYRFQHPPEPGADMLPPPSGPVADSQPFLVDGPRSGNVNTSNRSGISSAATSPDMSGRAVEVEESRESQFAQPSDLMDLPTLQFEEHMNSATLSYSEVLADTLGSSVATSRAFEATGTDDVVSNLWDQFLVNEQSFDNFDNFSFEDLPPIDRLLSTSARENPTITTKDDPKVSVFEETAIKAGLQAFKASGWNWRPTSLDCDFAEHSSLILPPDSVTPEALSVQPQDIMRHQLSAEDRHRILSLLLNYCDKEHWIRIASTFPTEPFLDNMLERFFISQRADTFSWFHIASFNPEKIQDELLVAIIAYGSCLTATESIQRFGYVIPELLRYAVIDHWTKDNSTSRDPQLLQAWSILSELSSWSGNKRRMEIGESNLQPLVTIIRRAYWLRLDHYRSLYPKADDEGAELYHKWQSWIEQETKKRLIYRTFVFDTQMSMTNHVNPLMSYSEMRVPLPDPNEMWWAESAEAWKVQYLRWSQHAVHDQPTLLDAVRAILSNGEWPKPGSTPTSTLYTIYGFWGLVWEHNQLQETLNSADLGIDDASHDVSGSMLLFRREMLVKALSTLRNTKYVIPDDQSPTLVAEPMLVLEYLSMVLNIPLQGVQAFAGRDGEREARRSYPVLLEWSQTREARQAMWHAGQIYRVAKNYPAMCTRDLRVTLVYQASIACWVYGVIVNASQRLILPSDGQGLSLQRNGTLETLVWLDGDYNAVVRRFIALSDGVPALHDLVDELSQQLPTPVNDIRPCRLENGSATMSLAIDILRQPSRTTDEAQLLLVDSITRLMLEIGKVARILWI